MEENTLPLVPLSSIRIGPDDGDEFPALAEGRIAGVGEDDGCRIYWIPLGTGPGMGFSAVAVEWGIAESWDDPNGTFHVLLRIVARSGGALEIRYGNDGFCFMPLLERHSQIFQILRKLELEHCHSPHADGLAPPAALHFINLLHALPTDGTWIPMDTLVERMKAAIPRFDMDEFSNAYEYAVRTGEVQHRPVDDSFEVTLSPKSSWHGRNLRDRDISPN
jgi:hypothetical protein